MRVGFVGDVAPLGCYANPDNLTISPALNQLLSSCDFVVANLECSVIDGNETIMKDGHAIGINENALNFLQRIGVTHVSLANNHSVDFGEKYLHHTINCLRKIGIDYFGTIDKPSVLLKYNKDAMIIDGAVSCDTNPDTKQLTMLRDLLPSKQKCTSVLYVHWGGSVEDGHVPNRQQIEFSNKTIGRFYDMIIGSHSHTIQDLIGAKRQRVFYGIGNLCFASLDSGKFLSNRRLERRRMGRVVISDLNDKDLSTFIRDIYFNDSCKISELSAFQWLYLKFMLINSSIIIRSGLQKTQESWLHIYYPVYSYFFNNKGGFISAIKKLEFKRILEYLRKWKK